MSESYQAKNGKKEKEEEEQKKEKKKEKKNISESCKLKDISCEKKLQRSILLSNKKCIINDSSKEVIIYSTNDSTNVNLELNLYQIHHDNMQLRIYNPLIDKTNNN